MCVLAQLRTNSSDNYLTDHHFLCSNYYQCAPAHLFLLLHFTPIEAHTHRKQHILVTHSLAAYDRTKQLNKIVIRKLYKYIRSFYIFLYIHLLHPVRFKLNPPTSHTRPKRMGCKSALASRTRVLFSTHTHTHIAGYLLVARS